ncbi:hypothetical protein BKA82DRAFT_996698 [Pisolithus tinctorius]|uniref:Uncharacterized protein n=1 Tax=Pisolithus tinctorius Marx 270 TaxID=870435 RepID=A0A0C3PK27_PISTI|nr:hypothetical protein BKA82DRAFT_996698 [Pisolithus tinctorius]KIO08976.1 hypothetical protein M404DRAFT_996698 [Pisolithus tinctorius Marx 270]
MQRRHPKNEHGYTTPGSMACDDLNGLTTSFAGVKKNMGEKEKEKENRAADSILMVL